MSWVTSNSTRHLARAAVLAVASMGAAVESQAQNHTADPYKPYNQQYEQFVYPTYPSGLGLTPNQGVLEGQGGLRSANQFQRFLNEEEELADELNPTRRRRSGPGIPYYSAYRQYDRQYDRVYQANRKSDEAFYEEKQARHDKYLAYLKERDPRRRAELYREYTAEARRSSRELESTRSTPSRRTPASAKESEPRQRPAAGAGRSPLFSGPRPGTSAGAGRTATPSEVLRQSEELETPKRSRTLTAPGLAPRTEPSEPR